MKILDKWDSQYLYLAKGWFTTSIYNVKKDNSENVKPLIAKYIWADRCGIKVEHVEFIRIVQHLLDLMLDLGVADSRETFLSFVTNCSPHKKYSVLYSKPIKKYTVEDFHKSVFNSCMRFLNLLPVKEGGEILIDMDYIDEEYKIENIEERIGKEVVKEIMEEENARQDY